MSVDSSAEPPAPGDDARPPERDDARPHLVLITGLSGSGKSVAAAALEDLGYHCVDNLPVSLLRTFLRDPLGHLDARVQRVAIVADARAPGFADAPTRWLDDLDRTQLDVTLVFLEADEHVLVRRYSESRRSHPLGEGERPVIEGIRRERVALAALRGVADLVFDTGSWTVHELRRALHRLFGDAPEGGRDLTVSLVSFGFKHGLPRGSDLVFDVRFLGNPYFVPELRPLTGCDAPIQDFLDAQPDFAALLDQLAELLRFLLPRYRSENRSYLTVSIGCTGGRHRSVATCERLAAHLANDGWQLRISHRDLERAGALPAARA